jgi:hypothetical protein
VDVFVSQNKATMKFAESIDTSFHEAIVGLLFILISTLLCLREQEGPRRGRKKGGWWVAEAVRTRTTFIE